MNTKRKASSFVHCVIGISLLCATPALAKNHKVDICHVPPGNPANAHTITVSENAVDAHMAHGDNMGPCVVETTVEESETPEDESPAEDQQFDGTANEQIIPDGEYVILPDGTKAKINFKGDL